VSRLFGKLDASRHLIVGRDCARAGAETVAATPAAAPTLALLRKERRC
jgi:hypothetical protein